ncbi:MAG: TlpA family protein disulfide reductase, partial [Blastocatellia bacterium]
VLLIDFWATWCIPCASEIPMFNSMQQQYKDKGLEIVGVSTDEGGSAQVKPFLVQHPMQYTVAIAGDEVKKAFGVGDTLPVTLVVDKQGRIRYSHTGITSPDTLRTEVEGLLKD